MAFLVRSLLQDRVACVESLLEVRLTPWTSEGYLRGATGPLARIFHWLISTGRTPWIDRSVRVALLLIGLELVVGIVHARWCGSSIVLSELVLSLYVPTLGVPQPNAEGTYLIVNKTLIEAIAVVVLLAFDTGRIAGLDLLLRKRRGSV